MNKMFQGLAVMDSPGENLVMDRERIVNVLSNLAKCSSIVSFSGLSATSKVLKGVPRKLNYIKGERSLDQCGETFSWLIRH